MQTDEMFRTVRAFTYLKGRMWRQSSDLLQEIPLEIVVNGQSHILIMFTPGMVRELVMGFLFTEGLIRRVSDVTQWVFSKQEKPDGDLVMEAGVTLSEPRKVSDKSRQARTSYSSCGICGSENYYDLKRGLGRVKSKERFSMKVLQQISTTLESFSFQPLYKRTGGAHAAVLFNQKGAPVLHSEDMGRHNALDKVIGAMLMKEVRPHDKIVVSSGRASLEMILKAARAGFPVFVAMSRPTSRAVQAAKFYNITLVDMAKGTNRIYSHVRRIKGF